MEYDMNTFEGVLRSLGLSGREARVTIEVVSGKLDKEIALTLRLSVRTVKEYERRARQKLGVTNRAGLTFAATLAYFQVGVNK